MNAASTLTLHLALAAAAGYAAAAVHLSNQQIAVQRPAGVILQTSAGTATGASGGSHASGASYRGAALRAGVSVVTVYCAAASDASTVVAVASGVVLDRDGLVVTTSEVAGHSGRMAVTLPDGTRRPARFLGVDAGAGLALLKVEGAALVPIELSAPASSAVGDTVLAVGDALGLGPTVTQGIISAVRPAQLEGSQALLDFIQTDASVHPGNFGGALVDVDGRLVGIIVGIVGGDGAEGLAFAVPAQRVGETVTKLHAAHARPAPPRVAPDRGRFTEVSFQASRELP